MPMIETINLTKKYGELVALSADPLPPVPR